MIRMTRIFTIFSFLMLSLHCFGQSSLLYKKVNLVAQTTTLRTVLKLLSTQTGCVFSYDPVRISDKKEIHISALQNISLKIALQNVLPNYIQFNLIGKYIVLQEITLKPKLETNKTAPTINSVQKTKPTSNLNSEERKTVEVANQEKEPNDSVSTLNITIPKEANAVKPRQSIEPNLITIVSTPTINSDTVININSQKNIEKAPQPILTTGNEKIKTPEKLKVSLGLSFNSHLGTYQTQFSYKNIYSLLSLGTDYYKTYHLGVGVGIDYKLNKAWGLGLNLIRYAIVGGKSYKLNVRTTTFELNPVVSYTILKRITLFAGGSAYIIKSKYVKPSPSTNLGSFGEFSPTAGIKLNL